MDRLATANRFVNRPAALTFAAACGGTMYLIVTRLLMLRAILLGRNKLAVMLLSACVVTWRGLATHAPICVGLLANDAERQGPVRTLAGSGISTGVVFGVLSVLRVGADWLLRRQTAIGGVTRAA